MTNMKAVSSLIQRVVDTIRRYEMITPGQRVGAAVSGGADSMCLLHVLNELAREWQLRVIVLHLNHGLRGEESDGDAVFVAEAAASLHLPYELRIAQIAGVAKNLEAAAREARLAFYGDCIARGLVDRVATGHTRSDQAETVMFRFLRGAGTAGLAGIRPATADGIIRPLLEVSRAEVEQFLTERGVPWRNDSTNASRRFARNRIRHDLLPGIAADWNPEIEETLAHTADWALAEETWWETETARLAAGLFQEAGDGVVVEANALARLPLAAGRRLVRKAILNAKGDLLAIDYRHIEAILALAARDEGHGRVQAPGLGVCRSFDWLRFVRPKLSGTEQGDYEMPLALSGNRMTVRPPGSTVEFHLELIEKSETSTLSHYVYNSEMGGLDWRRLTGRLEFRNWRPGDRLQPLGSAGEEKIKTLFQQARIPIWERRQWPVLAQGPTVVWARRFGPDARVAANSCSKSILLVREDGASKNATLESRIGFPPHGV